MMAKHLLHPMRQLPSTAAVTESSAQADKAVGRVTAAAAAEEPVTAEGAEAARRHDATAVSDCIFVTVGCIDNISGGYIFERLLVEVNLAPRLVATTLHRYI